MISPSFRLFLVAVTIACAACKLDSANAQRTPRSRPNHAPPLVPLRSTSLLVQDVVEQDAPRVAPPIPTQPPTIVTRGRWTDVARGLRVHRSTIRALDNGQAMELAWITLRATVADVRFGAAATVTGQLGAAVRAPIRAAIVAGFFESDKRPSGILEAGGQVLGQHHLHAGSGVLVVRDGRARVVAAASAEREWAGADLAVQCGPRLVEAGPAVGVYSDRGDRYARAAACVRDGGATVDFIVTWSLSQPLRGPGLLSFAQLLAGPSPAGDATGCEVALNLDGGPSAGIVVDRSDIGSHPAVGPVPWAIVLAPR
jgi:hypothetical protein